MCETPTMRRDSDGFSLFALLLGLLTCPIWWPIARVRALRSQRRQETSTR